MATGVKPRDEEIQFSRSDLEAIQDAMKNKKFRELLTEYCEEVRDPANQALYQKEMTQLEKERGYDITFINPKGGYVIKTSVAGDRKAFINICSNDNIGKPSHYVQEVNGKRGLNWQIPYSILPPREDYDQNKKRCVIYDVVFHPNTLRMAEGNKQFRDLVNNTAFEGLQKTYNIHLDSNNFRFPKSSYKGMAVPAVIRKEDPTYKPPDEEENAELSQELMDKLYPQHSYSNTATENSIPSKPIKEERRKLRKVLSEFNHKTENGYTIPKYVLKQQKNVDLQEFTYHRDSKKYSAIPSHIVVEVNLPLLSSTKDCKLDVSEQSLSLISEKPAKYKLNISLPYPVNDECGNAKFDKTLHKLIVTLPVIKNFVDTNKDSHKVDSGVESEGNASQSDEENNSSNLVVELSSTVSNNKNQTVEPCAEETSIEFFESSLAYLLPQYTYNVLDDAIAVTLHVKNTEPDSVEVKTIGSKVYIKFTSTGSGYVPIHYAATVLFDDNVTFENVSGEAWDNNVILQIELGGDMPQKFLIGLDESSLTEEHLDITQIKKDESIPVEKSETKTETDTVTPVVEVTNLASETNIVVSTNIDDDGDDDAFTEEDKKIVWTETYRSGTGAKSILRKSSSRSYSELSIGDVASSMDYISSDCIPEESSFKKTVRFNNVIARQFYRYNSSIEGQKKKNQRKKSKKRNQERRKSESEAEEECGSTPQSSKLRLKSALKQRRDSGLADTSDAEEFKTPDSYNNQDNNNSKSIKSVNNAGIVDAKSEYRETTNKSKEETDAYEKIKHNTDLYDPERLNKGKYLEVSFKNDLIFDLDM